MYLTCHVFALRLEARQPLAKSFILLFFRVIMVDMDLTDSGEQVGSEFMRHGLHLNKRSCHTAHHEAELRTVPSNGSWNARVSYWSKRRIHTYHGGTAWNTLGSARL